MPPQIAVHFTEEVPGGAPGGPRKIFLNPTQVGLAHNYHDKKYSMGPIEYRGIDISWVHDALL